MIAGKKVLAVIPARGGSKGIANKNIRNFAGEPLLAWTIKAARASQYIDYLMLSSDDAAIIATAEKYGCAVPFIRPPHLAEDDTPGIDPILHAVSMVPDYDIVTVLQPTSPLRSTADIDESLRFMLKQQAPACVSVSPSSKSPFWSYLLDDEAHMQPLFPGEESAHRQQLPMTFSLNGAVYHAEIAWLLAQQNFITAATVAYVMPPERAVDLDTESDFVLAEALRVVIN